MAKVVITGHMGFIGSYLWNEFPEATGLDIKDGNDILTCDLPDADVIFHLAAEPGVLKSMEDPVKNAMTNVIGTIRLAQRYKDKRFIFASSGGTIQKRIRSPYGMSKLCCEKYIRLLCKDYVILRFPNVYGSNSRSVIDKFINKDIEIYGSGLQTRTFAHISDVIDALKQSVSWKKGLYKLGTGQNYSVLDIAKATGKPYVFTDKRKGELLHSRLDNVTPGWSAKVDAIQYIKELCHTT